MPKLSPPAISMPKLWQPAPLPTPETSTVGVESTIVHLLEQILEQQQAQTEHQRAHLRLLMTMSGSEDYLPGLHSKESMPVASAASVEHPRDGATPYMGTVPMRCSATEDRKNTICHMTTCNAEATLRKFASMASASNTGQVPTGIPHALLRFLTLTCVLPVDSAMNHMRMCWAYRLCPLILSMSHAVNFAWNVQILYINMVVVRQRPSAKMFAILMFVLQLMAALPIWINWRRQFSSGKHLWALIEDLGEQCVSPNFKLLTVAVSLTFGMMLMYHVYVYWTHTTVLQTSGNHFPGWDSSSLHGLQYIVDVSGRCGQCLTVCAFICHVCLVNTVVRLYEHDLRGYIQVLRTYLVTPPPDLGVVQALGKMEELINARLLHASETWLVPVLFAIGTLGFVSAIVVTYILTRPMQDNSEILALVLTCSCAAVSALFMLYPVARIDSFFDREVLRAANQAEILHCAQKVFGQQLLAHVKGLDWGLKLAKRNISLETVLKIVFALVMSVLTTLGRVVFSQVGL